MDRKKKKIFTELRSKIFDVEASLFIYLQIISYPIFFRSATSEVMTVQEANFASLFSPQQIYFPSCMDFLLASCFFLSKQSLGQKEMKKHIKNFSLSCPEKSE